MAGLSPACLAVGIRLIRENHFHCLEGGFLGVRGSSFSCSLPKSEEGSSEIFILAIFQTIPEKGRRQRGVVHRAEGDLSEGIAWKYVEGD